eukprot:5329404-Pyramimonas_sp.AAC.1
MEELLSVVVYQATTSSKQFVVNKLGGRVRTNLASGECVRVRVAFPCQPRASLQRLVVKIDPGGIPQLKKARA